MMTKELTKVREQMQVVCIDDLVPQDHLLRIIDKAIDWSFIYDLVEDKYSQGNGRPSIDPVVLIKIPFIQYVFCKYFLDKVAKHFWTLLHVQIGQSCKALASHDQTSHLMPCRHF
mgnify:CR=1 FL=1